MINERTEFLKGIVKIKQNYIDNIDKYEWSALLSDYIGSEVIDVALMEKEVLVIRKPNKESETYSKDMTLYKDIHKIYGDLKNKSLFLGNGIFETNTKGRTIKHPIITQQLSIMFDSLNGTFLLKPKKKPQLLTHIIPEKLNLEHLGEVIEMFGETNVLPCSAKAKELFVTMTNLLSADNDSYHISDAPILFYAENDIDNYINYINFLDHMKEQPSAVSTSPYSILMGTRVNTGSFINEHHTSELVDVYSLNKDQRKAAHDLMDNEMTVLLGPPGTGKTTTIGDAASLVAQAGDSVLITSKNSAAIEAVKDKLPDKIADISIFLDKDNDTRSVSKALDKVLDYYNKYSSSDIREKEVALERAIEELEKRIKDGIKCTNEEIKSEQKWIKVGEQLFENKETLDLVPDSTDNKFSIYDLEKLYQTNCISATEERLFKTNILENLKTPKELKQTLCKVDGSEKTLGELLKYFKLFIYDVWMAEAALEREDGPYHKLKFSIEKMLKEKKTFLDTFPNVHIEVNMKSLDAIKAELPKIHKAFSGKGKLTKLLHMKASVKECMESIIVDGEKMQNAFDCEAVKQYLIWKFAQENTATLWNKLIARHGLPEFKQVNERTILRTADLIAIAFEFFDHFDCLKEQLEVHGENWETFLCINDRYDPQSTVITKTIDAIGNLEAFVIDKENCLNRTKRKTEFSKAIEIASELIPYEKALGEMLIKALEDSSLEEYEKHYREVADLLEKKERVLSKREVLLKRLTASAPELAKRIEERQAEVYMCEELPVEIRTAYESKEMIKKLERAAGESRCSCMTELIRERETDIQRLKEELAFWKILANIIEKLENDNSCYQDMIAFQLTMHRIGKGTGKKADKLKEALKNLFGKIQQVIPIWMMTADRVFEFVNKVCQFNYVIVDEASELDLTYAPLAAIAGQLMIVGDEKQAESITIGISEDVIKPLQEGYLGDLANNHLYNYKLSLFDLARMHLGKKPQMLKEHYRSHPTILEFCNDLSYNGKLVSFQNPIQDLEPVIGIKVAGEKTRKKNHAEAEAIVNKVKEVINDLDYAGLSIGIVSLVGKEQAELIEKLLLKEVDYDEIIKREIIVGTSVQLQGKERDVILISCVDAPHEGKTMSLKTGGNNDWFKKRMNVAFSRAKTQLIVFHSFDQGDLQRGDIRQKILSFVRKATKITIGTVELTNFEDNVYRHLVNCGYSCFKGLTIGSYTIPLAVKHKGQLIILNCGEYSAEYQNDLERAGYKIKLINPVKFYYELIIGGKIKL